MRKLLAIYLVIIVSFMGFLGCSPRSRQEENKPKQEELKDKIPPSLASMDEDIHKIIEGLEGMDDVKEISPGEIKPKEEENTKKDSENKEEKSQEGGENNMPTFQQELIPQEDLNKIERDKESKLLEKWESAEKDLKSIHESWNDYESTAVKDGAGREKIEQMENTLNNLTSFIEMKNKDKALMEANSVILSLSDFLDLYKGNVDGILRKSEYMVRQSYMVAKEGDWEGAEEKTKQRENYITTLRQRADIKEDQKPLLEKLILSIEDLEKAIGEEKIKLLEIKRDIAIKNIESLLDELK